MFRNKNSLIKAIVCINALAASETELTHFLTSNAQEDRVLANYHNRTESTSSYKREWFLSQPFGWEMLFHLNPSSSVKDPALRRMNLRESKSASAGYDFISFVLAGLFVPKTALVLSGLNLLRNV
jgi:hypothetical protein